MKKQLFTVIISGLLLLTACGSNVQNNNNGNSNDDFVALAPFKKEATIEETILYNENNLKITATSLTYGNYSADLALKFENNSDKNLTFIAQSIGYSRNAINDTMLKDGYVSVDVVAGGTETDTMSFNYDDMLLYGITEIGTIQTGFWINDDDYNDIYTGAVDIKTTAANTAESGTTSFRKTMKNKALQYNYEFTLDYFSDKEIYSSAGISVNTEILITNKNGKQTLMLEEINNSDIDAEVYIKDIKVNDKMVYEGARSSEIITPGKRAIGSFTIDNILDEDKKKELGITDIESIGFTVLARNTDFMIISEPEEVTISLK